MTSTEAKLNLCGVRRAHSRAAVGLSGFGIRDRTCQLMVGLLTIGLVSFVGINTAVGQSRFSWEVHGGGNLPISAYVHNGLRVARETISEAGDEVLASRLVDQYNAFGFHIGTTFTLMLNRLELRYNFNRLLWDHEITRCVSNPTGILPVELDTDEIDDSAVDYLCNSGQPLVGDESSLVAEGLSPLLVHVLSVGYRFYIPERSQRFDFWFAGAFGPAIATYNASPESTSDLFGAQLSLGLTGAVNLSEALSIGLETRYNLLITAVPGSVQQASNHAVSTGSSTFSALFNPFQYMTFAITANVHFR